MSKVAVKRIKQSRLNTRAASIHSCRIFVALFVRTCSSLSRRAFFCRRSRMFIRTGSEQTLARAGLGSMWLVKFSSSIASSSFFCISSYCSSDGLLTMRSIDASHSHRSLLTLDRGYNVVIRGNNIISKLCQRLIAVRRYILKHAHCR